MILLRHGQSEFNVVYSATGNDPGIPDPALTDEGRRQIAASARELAAGEVRRLVSSPYVRALESAEIVAGLLDVPISVDARVCERYAFTCDIGTRRGELAARWPHLDFAHLDDRWWPGEEETESELAARAAGFRTSVENWAGEGVVVVTHWGFIRALTGYTAANAEIVPFDPVRSRV